jgi:Mrp family chromosome partitioning ATPase
MILDRKSVIEALKPVIDPELGMSIVDLGMVKEVRVEGDDDVYVKVALTVPGCPLVDKIRDDIQTALKDASSVNVEFTSMTAEELEVVREKLRQRAADKSKSAEVKKGSLPESTKQPVTGITKLSKTGIRNIIAVASGKGGVGKSFVTGMLASELAKRGFLVGVLDTDITGPSMAKVFGLTRRVKGGPRGIMPAETKFGIKVISMNLVLDKPDEAVVWRGPILNSVIRQMYTDVDWGDLHYLLIDLPPGTSDAPLTVYQSMPLNGSVIVSTPQDLALMIVKKAIRMAKTMKIPVLGLIENMSYLRCPGCNERFDIFGPSKGEETARDVGIPFLGAIPLDPAIPKFSDEGRIEDYNHPEIEAIVDKILQSLKKSPEAQTAQPVTNPKEGA